MNYPIGPAKLNPDKLIKAKYRLSFNDTHDAVFPLIGDIFKLYSDDEVGYAKVVMADFTHKFIYLEPVSIDTDE